MWKQASAAILLLAFMTSCFCRALIVFDYYSNTAAFAKNCENKAIPSMHCNGKCQMMKKLRQEQKKDQDNPERKADNKVEIISSRSFFTCYHYVQYEDCRTYSSGAIKKTIDRSYSLLRPPLPA